MTMSSCVKMTWIWLYVLMMVNFKSVICNGRFEDKVSVDTNVINQDDRRAADAEDLKSTELQTSSSYRSKFYLQPSYEHTGFDPQGSSGHYLPPYYETGNHHGSYGFYEDTGHHHHTYKSPSGHGGSHTSSFGGLALKGLLIPLAGIALLGAAAALSTNPVLLQLGVLNGRRRRSLSEAYPLNPRTKPEKIT